MALRSPPSLDLRPGHHQTEDHRATTMKAWIQLGRSGDIMSILPLLWKDAQDGKRWSLMVASEYASVLDGVSYVDPIIFDGPHYDIGGAVKQAEEQGLEWFSTQVNGPKDVVAELVYEPAGQ